MPVLPIVATKAGSLATRDEVAVALAARRAMRATVAAATLSGAAVDALFAVAASIGDVSTFVPKDLCAASVKGPACGVVEPGSATTETLSPSGIAAVSIVRSRTLAESVLATSLRNEVTGFVIEFSPTPMVVCDMEDINIAGCVRVVSTSLPSGAARPPAITPSMSAISSTV